MITTTINNIAFNSINTHPSINPSPFSRHRVRNNPNTESHFSLSKGKGVKEQEQTFSMRSISPKKLDTLFNVTLLWKSRFPLFVITLPFNPPNPLVYPTQEKKAYSLSPGYLCFSTYHRGFGKYALFFLPVRFVLFCRKE